MVQRLLASSLDLRVERATSSNSAARVSTSFGAPANLDLERKLKEKECDDKAEREGQRRRDDALDAEAARVVRSASEAWSAVSSQSEMCLQIDVAERGGCIGEVEAWLTTAECGPPV